MEISQTSKRASKISRTSPSQQRIKNMFLLVFVQASILWCAMAQESLKSCTLSVEDSTVSANTILTLNIQFNSERIDSNDYLLVTLPDNRPTGNQFSTSGSPSCTSDVSVSSCQILSTTQAKLNYDQDSDLSSVENTISNFINPLAVEPIFSIVVQLYDEDDNELATYTNGFISNFQTSTIDMELESSSSTIGELNVNLEITLTPATYLASVGAIKLDVPDYYDNAYSDFYFDNGDHDCSADVSDMVFTLCQFSQFDQQLEIQYEFTDGQDFQGTVTITVSDFNNPITSDTVTGFAVGTQVDSGYSIAQGSASLSGINTPAPIEDFSVTFLETNEVGLYSGFQIQIELGITMEQYCYVKIVIPPDFGIDEYLSSFQGSGIFKPSSNSQSVTPTSIDFDNREIIVPACGVNYGTVGNLYGTLSLNDLRNPLYVHTTESFEIYVAKDEDFTDMLCQQTTGLEIQSSEIIAGPISDIEIEFVDSDVVQTYTSFQFTFTPGNIINDGDSAIEFVLPSLITLDDSQCEFTKIYSTYLFDDLTNCDMDLETNTITLSNPFDGMYPGGEELIIQFTNGLNPESSQDLGSFTIRTYATVDGSQYLVDETSVSNVLSTDYGKIYKDSEIVVSSYYTSEQDTSLTFYLSFEHNVKTGGSLRIILNDNENDLLIRDDDDLESSCQNTFGGSTYLLSCKESTNSTGYTMIDIDVNTQGFGSDGIVAGTNYVVYMEGFTNPRFQYDTVPLMIITQDEDDYWIDVSQDNDVFSVEMTQLSSLNKITIEISNDTNAATCDYEFFIVTNTEIQQNDKLFFTFPDQIELPDDRDFECEEGRRLDNIDCDKLGSHEVSIWLRAIDTINANTQFSFTLFNIKNPVSTAETDPFTDIYLYGAMDGFYISNYDKDLTVQTSEPNNITEYYLIQESKDYLVWTEYSIVFESNSKIPPEAGIKVDCPSEVEVDEDEDEVYVYLNSKVSIDVTFGDNTIFITGAFDREFDGYEGDVEVQFTARNPGDNSETDSIKLYVYSDDTFKHMVDIVEDGLIPQFQCAFPCYTCDYYDTSYCRTCDEDERDYPQYLQYFYNDTVNQKQTCVFQCFEGYTSNGTSNPAECTACDESCKTCRDEGQANDAQVCLSCSDDYPYNNYQLKECYADECPYGQYEWTSYSCDFCISPCLDCTGPQTCTACDPSSDYKYMQNEMCVKECDTGFTPIDNECVMCDDPCATCEVGQPSHCLSCNGFEDKQFVFGQTCVEACPEGTTIDEENQYCLSCEVGCELCDNLDFSKCLICDDGLALHEDKCLSDCPFNFIRSEDGKVCEARTYPLDSKFILFPFLCTTFFIWLVAAVSYRLTAKRSLILVACIGFNSVVEQSCILYQLYYSLDRQYWLLFLGSLFCFMNQIILNLCFIYQHKRQVDPDELKDKHFEAYKEEHYIFRRVLFTIMGCFSFKFIRVTYCKLFGIGIFYSKIKNPDLFLYPIFLFTGIQSIVVVLPLLVVNSMGLYFLEWGNQLWMTMLESSLLSIFQIYLQYVEYQNRYDLIKKDEKNIDFYQDVVMAGSQKIKDVVSGGLTKVNSMLPSLPKRKESDEEPKPLIKFRNEKGEPVAEDASVNQIEQKINMSNPYSVPEIDPNDTGYEEQGTHRAGVTKGISKAEELRNQLENVEGRHGFLKDIINQVKKNQSMKLNLTLDHILGHEIEKVQLKQRLHESMCSLEKDHDQSLICEDQLTDDNFYSDPCKSESDHEIKRQIFKKWNEERLLEIKKQEQKKRQKLLLLQKMQEQQDASEDDEQPDNVYADVKDIDLMTTDRDMQTDAKDRDEWLTKHLSELRKDESITGTGLTGVKQQAEIKGPQGRRKRRGKGPRGKGESILYDAIYEEDDDQDDYTDLASINTNFIQNHFENQDRNEKQTLASQNMVSLALKAEKDSLTNLYEYGQNMSQNAYGMSDKETILEVEKEQEDENDLVAKYKKKKEQKRLQRKMRKKHKLLGDDYSPSRMDGISGSNQRMKEDQQENIEYLGQNRIDEENLNAWIKDDHVINQRTFNDNEIYGAFDRDKNGQIIDRDRVLREMNYRDKDGKAVNQKGYLVDESTGDIRSKYTFDVLFPKRTLSKYGEIPMPYRLERYNFNPHEVLGYLEYENDKSSTTKFKQTRSSKLRQLIDKIQRPINYSGFLIDEKGNIIDQQGHIKFLSIQIDKKGKLPTLYNYDGLEYNILNIIGQFDKDPKSKKIIFSHNHIDGTLQDNLGRKVNSAGYLIDKYSNIIDNGGVKYNEKQDKYYDNFRNEISKKDIRKLKPRIVFQSYQLLFNEPPKIFKFTKWSKDWIRGNLDRDVTQNKKHDDQYDLDGRAINTMGYLIDKNGNIINRKGQEVFSKEILSEKYGQDAEIPVVFRGDYLLNPAFNSLDSELYARRNVVQLQDIQDEEMVLNQMEKINFGSDGRHFSSDNDEDKEIQNIFEQKMQELDIEEIPKDDEIARLTQAGVGDVLNQSKNSEKQSQNKSQTNIQVQETKPITDRSGLDSQNVNIQPQDINIPNSSNNNQQAASQLNNDDINEVRLINLVDENNVEMNAKSRAQRSDRKNKFNKQGKRNSKNQSQSTIRPGKRIIEQYNKLLGPQFQPVTLTQQQQLEQQAYSKKHTSHQQLQMITGQGQLMRAKSAQRFNRNMGQAKTQMQQVYGFPNIPNYSQSRYKNVPSQNYLQNSMAFQNMTGISSVQQFARPDSVSQMQNPMMSSQQQYMSDDLKPVITNAFGMSQDIGGEQQQINQYGAGGDGGEQVQKYINQDVVENLRSSNDLQ